MTSNQRKMPGSLHAVCKSVRSKHRVCKDIDSGKKNSSNMRKTTKKVIFIQRKMPGSLRTVCTRAFPPSTGSAKCTTMVGKMLFKNGLINEGHTSTVLTCSSQKNVLSQMSITRYATSRSRTTASAQLLAQDY